MINFYDLKSFFFRESIQIGKTDFSENDIEQIIKLLGREFRGIDYHLINNNCNHFTDKLCKVRDDLTIICLFYSFKLILIKDSVWD